MKPIHFTNKYSNKHCDYAEQINTLRGWFRTIKFETEIKIFTLTAANHRIIKYCRQTTRIRLNVFMNKIKIIVKLILSYSSFRFEFKKHKRTYLTRYSVIR